MDPGEFRKFVQLLESRGELTRVRAEVDPVLELAAITDRVCKSPGGGRALWFERVRGHSVPVLTNLFGSPRRMAWGLGAEELSKVAERLCRDLGKASGDSSRERLRGLISREPFRPRSVSEASCREVRVDPPDLRILPAPKAWPRDGGRFLTLPLVFTRHPETGESNCGMYRVQIFDSRSAALHWSPQADGARHHVAWSERGEPMPVAVALGGDPALIYAAAAPLPSGLDEAAFAGYLRGRPVEMTGDLQVPADAEFVIEGFVMPGETRPEGPFGNHTGYYAPAAPCPVLHVTSMTHRRDPLFPATVVGRPPMENCQFARATEALFLPLLQIDFPQLADLRFILEGIFHGCALVAVRRGGPPDRGRSLIRSLWEGGMLKSSRLLVALDEEVDIRDPSLCLWRAINHLVPERDVFTDAGRLGIDATRRDDRVPLVPDGATGELLHRRWREYGIDLPGPPDGIKPSPEQV